MISAFIARTRTPRTRIGRALRIGILPLMALALAACQPAPAPIQPLPMAQASIPADAGPRRVFYSGHSLLQQPLQDHVELIAKANGVDLGWDRQDRFGSLLRQRTQGDDPAAETWTGWTSGENRVGKGLDVRAALAGEIPGQAPFDTLIVTERHDILWTLLHERTALHLRRMHDARVAGKPDGTTWLYESWQSLAVEDPARWIQYESDVAGAWQCVSAEVNRSLIAEGRADRVHNLPAARALAHLVQKATSAPGVPGLVAPAGTPVARLLFQDAVHPTPATAYYLAQVTWAFVSGAPAAQPAVPEGLDPALAQSLRVVAAEAHAKLRDQALSSASAAECETALQRLCPGVWSYMADRWQAEGDSWPRARWRQFQLQRQCTEGIRDGRYKLL